MLSVCFNGTSCHCYVFHGTYFLSNVFQQILVRIKSKWQDRNADDKNAIHNILLEKGFTKKPMKQNPTKWKSAESTELEKHVHYQSILFPVFYVLHP